MDKREYQERMRKIKWANKQAGQKWGKKELIQAQDMVITTLKDEPKTSGVSSFKEKLTQDNSMKLSIDLSQLIGKDFKK